jgi:hypothetical protein
MAPIPTGQRREAVYWQHAAQDRHGERATLTKAWRYAQPRGGSSRCAVSADDGWDAAGRGRRGRGRSDAGWAKSIISRNESPVPLPSDQSLPRLRARLHYCYARPSHAYLGVSGTGLRNAAVRKVNAAELLREETGQTQPSLRVDHHWCEYRSLSTHRAGWKITRQVLEVLTECEHPAAIITKNVLWNATRSACRWQTEPDSGIRVRHDARSRVGASHGAEASAPRRRIEALIVGTSGCSGWCDDCTCRSVPDRCGPEPALEAAARRERQLQVTR